MKSNISLVIIIPTKNRFPLLKRAIDSILNGIDMYYLEFDKYIYDLKIIIVYDNNDKGFYKTNIWNNYIKCMDTNKYKLKFHIELVDKNEHGVSNARNRALKYVTPLSRVLFLDDDDMLLPEYWKYVPALTDNAFVDVICTEKYVLYEDYTNFDNIYIPYNVGEQPFIAMSKGNYLSCMQVTFKGSIIKNAKFNTELDFNEDWDWWAQLFYDNNAIVEYYKYITCIYSKRKKEFLNCSMQDPFSVMISSKVMRRINERRYKQNIINYNNR